EGRVSLGLDPRLEAEIHRQVRHLKAIALGVELPAAIGAAQTRLFIAAEEQRRATVRAAMVENADLAVGVTKRDQLLAEQQEPQRRPVLRELARKTRRHPVFAHQLAARRSRADARQDFVVLM